MARPRLWVLNLDAEYELAGRTPSRAERARTQVWAESVAETLPPEDRWLARFEGDTRAFTGAAWCPTPGAVRALAQHGVTLRAPSVDVLRRVNDRAFAYALAALPGARPVTGPVAVPDGERVWLRRGLGFAGRGVRRATGPLSEADQRFVAAGLRQGNVFLEPEVDVVLDVALHGHTDGRRGCLTVAELERGQWRRSRVAHGDEVLPAEREAMHTALETAAAALVAAGYQGPFGIDGFRYRAPDGQHRFHPLSDLNARYSMGWALGMGGW